MPLIKSTQDIQNLRQAGKKLARVLQKAGKAAKAGVVLLDLEKYIREEIKAEASTPSFLGFEGYPAASCLSLNEQVVHGIPDERILKSGDILGIDIGLWFKGVCVDAAITVGIGGIALEAKALLVHTEESLAAGIKAAKPYHRVGAISQAIQLTAEKYEHGIVRTLTGHGVGHQVHEDPEIPNFGHSSDGILLRPGMVLAIEPMLTNGGGEVMTEIDGWGIVTADKSLSAQFEHTILITGKKAEILTSV